MSRYQRLQISLFCLSILGLFLLGACGRNETSIQKADKHNSPSIQIPLEEIAERIEYEYIYENMIYHIADYDYKQLSFLPSGEDIDVSFYTIEGNKLLFLPEEKANTEALVNGEMCNLYYSQEAGGYVFYVLVDWQLSENGVPVNSLESDYYHRIRECIVRDKDAVYEETDLHDSPIYFSYEFISDDLVKLGEAKVTFDPEERIEIQKVPAYGNEYIDSVWNPYYPAADSSACFTARWYLDAETNDFVRDIVGLHRKEILMKVKEEKDPEEETGSHLVTVPEYNQEIDFRTMDPEETAKLLRYVYSYEEWFGMNELGCQTGELRGLQGETINMYAWNNNGETLFFVPESKVNAYVNCENRVKCPVHVNKDGEMEFYLLKRNGYAGGKGQLKTTFFMEDGLSTEYAEDMVWLGETEFTLQELSSSDVAEIEEDEYICALREHIEDILQRNGRDGEYELNIGEYEVLHTNKVCLSAAVSGEEESYYFRYMIVRSENGKFYFWPAGFGLDSSLAECEAGKHSMNALCIERTRQLSRMKMMINENRVKAGNYYSDHEDLEKNHKILSYDICSSPRYDYENTPLVEYIEEDISWNEDMSKKAGKNISVEIDYHVFDFNNDGVEDYLLCESGRLFEGNGGDSVDIFIQGEEGVRNVLSTKMILHHGPHDHASVIVLDEKTGGYYAVVNPSQNFIFRYNEEEGRYDWPESEESILDVEDSQNEPVIGIGNEETNSQEVQSGLQSYDENRNTIRNNNYFIDLENLEEYHKILSYDICSSPRYDYENTPLAEYVEEIMEGIEEESREVGRPLPVEIEYHLFDFNDDGKEDYLLCIYGTQDGLDDEAVIFIQEEEGLRRVLYIDMPLCIRLDGSLHHYKLIVVDEKTNGYYGIAHENGNYILRYDVEQGCYDFGVRE